MKINKEEILNFIYKLDSQNERIVDILLEVQRKYQIEIQELPKLLDKKLKEKLKTQELQNKTIKE